MTRVTNIDAGQVYTTGLLNMRRFEQRSTETLVVGELFDKTVTITTSGVTGTVYDVGMEQARNRDWVISRVAVQEPAKALRRRGQTHLVEWGEVEGLTKRECQLHRPLRRHLEPVRQHAAGTWASRCASSTRPTRRHFRSADRRPHARLLCRDAAQPEAGRLPDRRGGGDRPHARHSADHGQHRRAAHLPAARAWRGHRRVLDHQIYRRAWHIDRRRHHRWRQFRLGSACRALPDAQHSPTPAITAPSGPRR